MTSSSHLVLPSGECLPLPPVLQQLAKPTQLDAVLSLINTVVFLPRCERCYRLLVADTLQPVHSWDDISPYSNIVALTQKLHDVDQGGPHVVVGQTLQPVTRRRAPPQQSGSASNRSSASNRPNSPGQDHYNTMMRHLVDYNGRMMSASSDPSAAAKQHVAGLRGITPFAEPVPSGSRTTPQRAIASLTPQRGIVTPGSSAYANGSNGGGVVTPSFSPSMHRSAVSLVSAIAKDKGAALIEAMLDAIEDKEREERIIRERLHPSGKPNVGDSIDGFEEELLISMLPIDAMDALTEMGFSVRAAARALLKGKLDVGAAVNALVSMTSAVAVEMETPIGPAEAKRFRALLGVEEEKHAPANNGSGAGLREDQRHNEKAGESPQDSALRRGEAQQRENLNRLLEMGFSAHDARHALRGTQGNFDTACAALLGDHSALARVKAHYADSNVSWFEPIDVMARCGTVDPQHVLDITRSLSSDPQSVLVLWHCPTYGPTISKMASVFATPSAQRGNVHSPTDVPVQQPGRLPQSARQQAPQVWAQHRGAPQQPVAPSVLPLPPYLQHLHNQQQQQPPQQQQQQQQQRPYR